MKKKILVNLATICLISMLLLSCIVVVPSLEEKSIDIKENVASSLNTIRKDYYNKYTEDSDVPTPSDFYVEIGEVGRESDPEVTIGDTIFISTDLVNLSIGKSSFIKDNVYMIKGGKIYIASPVLEMELSKEEPNIVVEGKAIYKTDFIEDLAELKVKGVYWNNNNTLGTPIYDSETNVATIEIPRGDSVNGIGQTMLGIDFRYGEGEEAPAFYITKKDAVKNDDKRGSGKTYNYGTTNTDGITSTSDSITKQNMLGNYPYGWIEDGDFNSGKKEDKEYSKEIDYKCKGCVVEGEGIKVVASGSVYLSISRASQAEAETT